MSAGNVEARQAQWLRGVLDLVVLAMIAEQGEGYGYTLLQHLADAGLPTVKAGTVYPLLNRLASEGLLHSEWRAGESGPGRKFFTVTDEGERVLDEQGREWAAFAKNVTAVVERGMT